MFKKLLAFLVVVIVAVVAANYLAFSPKFEYRVEREMAASPEAIVASFQDLRTWEDWSPWSKKNHPDDGVEMAYQGEPGPGMKWTWTDGKELGTGSLTLTRVTPTNADYDFEMTKPMGMAMQGGIELVPAGDKTRVTWWSKGEQDAPGIGRIMNTVFAGQVKKDYAKALEGLEAHATAPK